MNRNLHPVGTKVYTFRDNPFVILEGIIIEHCFRKWEYYICKFFDPILNYTYIESKFEVYLTKEAAEQAHTSICELLYKHSVK